MSIGDQILFFFAGLGVFNAFLLALYFLLFLKPRKWVNILYGLLMLTITIQLNAQSDEDLIRHSIQNYFNGTAYNYTDQIEAAFHPEANLFLENQAGELVIFSAADYIALFKKNEPGEIWWSLQQNPKD